ncbi:MAG: type IX secretion system protein PorQ [Bacteroidetes bacterium]|nr:type IX secretion system protein PorQ [Bacteroidota bacterium]MDA1119588.1 type IX secretion system protein PorQ [Bacteroidota bacterium]
MNRKVVLFYLIFFPIFVQAQFGGRRSFEFINLPSNARTAALGGVNVSHFDNNVDGFLSNPALLDSVKSGSIAFTHLGFMADVGLNNISYAQKFKKAGIIGFGVQYMDFGQFDGFDQAGIATGSFNADEFALVVGYSHRISVFSLGVNLKFVGTGIESYRATALMLDIGGQFKHPERDFTAGLVFKNLGFYLSNYTSTANSQLPFDVQLGITFKPEHMPVRFSITSYNLYKGDLTFFDPTSETTLVNTPAGVFDKVFRHFNIGTEFLIHRNFYIRAGYNHLIRKELRLDAKSGGAGISFGFVVRIKTFEFAYTRAIYHVAGGGNYFTISTNMHSIIKKKSKA